MANIYVRASGHQKVFDVINVALLFWPGSRIFEQKDLTCNILIHSSLVEKDGRHTAMAVVRFNGRRFFCQRTYRTDEHLRFIKLTLFFACQKATGICPPWGILTGIRPMSVYEKLEKANPGTASDVLRRDYLVSDEKCNALDAIYDFRKSVYYDGVREQVSLYVSIPFCPSKCTYCSFVSASVERVKKLVEPYLELLLQEIEQKIDLIYHFQKEIATVYVGGGTPGILSAEQIDRLLGMIFSKLKAPLREFCFEIGRPEMVTADKLAVLRKYPVDRLCINCQTLDDAVLQSVNRRHTAQDFIDACELAFSYGFNCINVDLIAGLPGEDVDGHISSLNRVIELGVQNITIHSLSIKKASTWQQTDTLYDPRADRVSRMLSQGYSILSAAQYKPYYIYRQKSTLSNGENIGYSVDGFIGKYNIYMMEDVHSVFGCGAGASTKIIHNNIGRIDRFVNTKYPQEYLKFPQKLNEQLAQIFENLEGNR